MAPNNKYTSTHNKVILLLSNPRFFHTGVTLWNIHLGSFLAIDTMNFLIFGAFCNFYSLILGSNMPLIHYTVVFEFGVSFPLAAVREFFGLS